MVNPPKKVVNSRVCNTCTNDSPKILVSPVPAYDNVDERSIWYFFDAGPAKIWVVTPTDVNAFVSGNRGYHVLALCKELYYVILMMWPWHRPTFYYDCLHINSLSHLSEPTPEATTNKELGSYLSLIDIKLLYWSPKKFSWNRLHKEIPTMEYNKLKINKNRNRSDCLHCLHVVIQDPESVVNLSRMRVDCFKFSSSIC